MHFSPISYRQAMRSLCKVHLDKLDQIVSGETSRPVYGLPGDGDLEKLRSCFGDLILINVDPSGKNVSVAARIVHYPGQGFISLPYLSFEDGAQSLVSSSTCCWEVFSEWNFEGVSAKIGPQAGFYSLGWPIKSVRLDPCQPSKSTQKISMKFEKQ